jgi:hypothetical protein
LPGESRSADRTANSTHFAWLQLIQSHCR